jgi:penicillin-binding protein 1A
VCSIALGSQAVSPLEMTSAYATLAARGIRRIPYAVAEVRTASGDVVHRREPKAKRAMARQDADVVTHVLQSVVTSGTGTAAALDRPVAGKTGTAQEWKDAWFCGYVPQLAACVWVGYRKGEIPLHNVHGYENVYGGSFPAMIWHDFMAVATEGMNVAGFVTPSLYDYNVYPDGTRPAPPPPPKPEKSPKPKPSKKPKPPDP